MNVLWKLTLRNLKENRKRTLVTIVGILLSSALITAVANMAESFRASMIQYEKIYSGDYHYAFYHVQDENLKYFENNRSIERYGFLQEAGYARLSESQNEEKPYLYLYAMDENAMKGASVRILEGRLPQNENEIIVASHLQTNGGVDIQIGDILTLDIGYREDNEGRVLGQWKAYLYEGESFHAVEQRVCTVVGIMEKPSSEMESRLSPGYTAVTYLEETDNKKTTDVYVTYTDSALKSREQITEGLSGVADYVEENIWLLKWELLLFSSNSMQMLYSLAFIAIVIIMASSIFCIRNSFSISLTEKMRLQGMLSSIGATKRQRKKLVYQEALLLGLVGIPLGVFCGTVATAVLVKFTGRLLLAALKIELIYAVSLPAMILGAILAAVTIYLSAGQSARKAAKVSPMTAIRAGSEIKNSKKISAPVYIKKLFGIGGMIAYKNLKRARRKYRTTVISIVVSVAVFIGMTAFLNMAFKASTFYYQDYAYQIRITMYGDASEKGNLCEKADEIVKFPGVEQAEVKRNMNLIVPKDSLLYSEEGLQRYTAVEEEEDAKVQFQVVSIGEEGYREYCRKLGIAVEEAEDKAILLAQYRLSPESENNGKYAYGSMFDYKKGDVITGIVFLEEGEGTLALEIAAVADTGTMSVSSGGRPVLIVSDKWMNQHGVGIYNYIEVFLTCEDADALESMIRADMEVMEYSINNMDQRYREDKALHLLIAIFLYGFIIVISLIGITNIFNTITTNMELKSREFAMLKAIGMTSREFKRMIVLESIFYGSKSLFIGIPIGIALSFGFHSAFARGVLLKYTLPWEGILIAIFAVFLLIFCVMRYSMAKINRKNIIDTIQNENI